MADGANLKFLSAAPNNRIVGYDLARAVALFGMLFINFSALIDEGSPDSSCLVYAIELIRGRAAATFVVLAGVGMSLLAKDGYLLDKHGVNYKRILLLKRAFFLLIIGSLNFLLSPLPDILHFYAFYLIIGTCLLTVSNVSLWVLTLATLTARPLLRFTLDCVKNWDAGTTVNPGFWSLSDIVGHIFFNGFYPALPWLAFVTMGMWLGRKNMASRGFRNKVLVAGVSTVCFAESLARSATYISSPAQLRLNLPGLLPYCTSVALDPMINFTISAMGTALVVISLSTVLADRCRKSRGLLPFVAVGQTTFTLYVAHIIVGAIILRLIELFELESLPSSGWLSILFSLAAMIFSHCWVQRFQRGPLELLMRRSLLTSKHLKVSFST